MSARQKAPTKRKPKVRRATQRLPLPSIRSSHGLEVPVANPPTPEEVAEAVVLLKKYLCGLNDDFSDEIRTVLAALEHAQAEVETRKLTELPQGWLAAPKSEWDEMRAAREKAEQEVERAIAFLRRAAYSGKEIVSTCRLSELAIANYRVAGLMYVEPGGGLGWVVRQSDQFKACSELLHQRAEKAEAALREIRSHATEHDDGRPHAGCHKWVLAVCEKALAKEPKP